MQLKTKILFRRDLYNNLKNLVLLEGEPCYATDTKQYVVGDGSSTFAELVAASENEVDVKINNTYWLSGGTRISSGEDLNNIKELGNYYCSADNISTTITHKPYGVTTAFTLKVESPLGLVGDYISQTLRTYHNGKIWYRYTWNGGTNWGGWTQYAQLEDFPTIPSLSLVDSYEKPIVSSLAVDGHNIHVYRTSLEDLGVKIKYITGESNSNPMTDVWKQIGGRTSSNYSIGAYYLYKFTADWLTGNAGPTFVFGAADTKGFISTSYHSPVFSIGGGNVDGSTDSDPRWYMKFTGSTTKTYNMDNFAIKSEVDSALDVIRENISTGSGGNTVYESYLKWGGRNLNGTFSPIDAALGSSQIGTNYFAFLPADCIEVHYSRDGGATWLNYECDDSRKMDLFAGGNHDSDLSIGNSTDSVGDKTNWQLRITVSAKSAVYTVLNKFIIRLSTRGSNNCWCTIEAKKYTINDWYTITDKAAVSGWSGHNVINIPNILYGNSSNGANSHEKIRFTFGSTSFTTGYAGLVVYTIEAFGYGGYTLPSELARTGHIYSYSTNQSVIFPNHLEAKGMIEAKEYIKAPTIYENGVSLSSKYLPLDSMDGSYLYVPMFQSNKKIVNSPMEIRTSDLTKRLVIGAESATEPVGIGGFGVRDMRENTPTRDMLGDYTFGMYFNDLSNGGAPLPGVTNNPWMSIFHVKGWGGNYQAWELAGPASSRDIDYGLYYRSSKGSNNTEWNNWHQIAFQDWVEDYVEEHGGSGGASITITDLRNLG